MADTQTLCEYFKIGETNMKDERKFKEVIHTIKGAEKDKDKFCKVARIERQPMSDKRCVLNLNYIAAYLALIIIFGFFFMLFNLCR